MVVIVGSCGAWGGAATGGACTGKRIVDLSRLLPGPYATSLLADLGADVIKVEDPVGGDPPASPRPSSTPSTATSAG
ncbi:CoA transferase [Streptomyces sp. NPDC059262]|uniref:CoA transferase n=1 Tax=Streptomyces sp. NPDC059262 TaxID=3346797 RepID=UPI0036C99241